MTLPLSNRVPHLHEEALSELVDQERLGAVVTRDSSQQHLETCDECQVRLANLRQTVALLTALPEAPLPRDFALGPRHFWSASGPSKKIVHLYRWTRTVASAAVAMFLVLVGASVYVDSVRLQPVSESEPARVETPLSTSGAPLVQPTPAATPPSLAPAAPPDGEPASAARMPAAPQQVAAPVSAPASARKDLPADNGGIAEDDPEDGEQRAATRGAAALPEPTVVPEPAALSAPTRAQVEDEQNQHSLLRNGAALTGTAAGITLLLALALRRRLT